MRTRWKIAIAVVVLAVLGCLFFWSTGNSAQRDLEATRKKLRAEGFKVDLSEFNLSLTADERRRAVALGDVMPQMGANMSIAGRRPFYARSPRLMQPTGKDAALVAWAVAAPIEQGESTSWAELQEGLGDDQDSFDAARVAAVSGPIRFEPIGRGQAALMPYLASMRQFETRFAIATILALHNKDRVAAWTNLLASTCLVTSYLPEPVEISHLVRMACANIAFQVQWNALQSHDWNEAELADLQSRWERLDLWTGLPDTAAYGRASMAAAIQLERKQPLGPFGPPGTTMSLSSILPWIMNYWREMQYRNNGSYVDEKALLLGFRDHEVELRSAIQKGKWQDMKSSPAATNSPGLLTRGGRSRAFAMLRLAAVSNRFQGGGQGMLGRAAETEARRRLIVAALALERYHIRHGQYPEALGSLVPDFLKNEPMDFMDGKPLRYRRSEDGRFVLYSVGLDCADNGGEMRRSRGFGRDFEMPDELMAGYGNVAGYDLVWPRPASPAEAQQLQEEEKQAKAQQIANTEAEQAEAQWQRTAERQSHVEKLLAETPKSPRKTPQFQGQPLADFLRNDAVEGTNRPTLLEMLTLKAQAGTQPEVVTFELPMKYEAVTNAGTLGLFVDPVNDDSDEGSFAGEFECRAATNGNCLLVWNTTYETPGKHALQAALVLEAEVEPNQKEIEGPMLPIIVSNLCQFSLTSAHLEPGVGSTFRAKLPESNASYTIELTLPSGEHVRTLRGSTATGKIQEFWDLKDDQGRGCTNEEYDSIVEIKLTESGREQKMKGP